MTDDTDRVLRGAALEIAQMVHEDITERGDIERVDVRGKSVHIVPTDAMDVNRDALENYAEDIVEEYPFAVSEWWADMTDGQTKLVVASYWPTGGQVTKEKLEQYDRFIAERLDGGD